MSADSHLHAAAMSTLARINAERDAIHAAHATIAQDAAPRALRVLPGGQGVAGQVRPGKPAGDQTFTLSARKTQLLLAALGGSGSSALHAIADDLSGQVHPSLLPAADWAPAHGIPRPGAS